MSRVIQVLLVGVVLLCLAVQIAAETPSAPAPAPVGAVADDIWTAHNFYDLSPLPRGTKLYVSSGNGQPGPLHPETASPGTVEQVIGEMSTAFIRRLHEVRVDVTANLYGPGTHNWPYWQRELHTSFPMLMNAIGVRTEAR